MRRARSLRTRCDLEFVQPERIARTFVFEAVPEAEAIEALVLEEHDGATTISTTTST